MAVPVNKHHDASGHTRYTVVLRRLYVVFVITLEQQETVSWRCVNIHVQFIIKRYTYFDF